MPESPDAERPSQSEFIDRATYHAQHSDRVAVKNLAPDIRCTLRIKTSPGEDDNETTPESHYSVDIKNALVRTIEQVGHSFMITFITHEKDMDGIDYPLLFTEDGIALTFSGSPDDQHLEVVEMGYIVGQPRDRDIIDWSDAFTDNPARRYWESPN